MNIKQIYKDVISEYKNKNFEIINFSDKKVIIDDSEYAIYAMNYLIYSFMKSKKDERYKLIFNFIIIPINLTAIDFTIIKFETFFKFMIETKNFN
jgi:hypothetical protein